MSRLGRRDFKIRYYLYRMFKSDLPLIAIAVILVVLLRCNFPQDLSCPYVGRNFLKKESREVTLPALLSEHLQLTTSNLLRMAKGGAIFY